MKRHVQYTGVRRWAGDDLIELQSEVFKVLDAFFAQYGNIIISGCEVDGDDVKPGIVGLRCTDSEGNKIFRVLPFAGRTAGDEFPVYLKPGCETILREYGDGKIKPVVNRYFAELSTVAPEGEDYITINRTGNKRFIPQAVKEETESMGFLRKNYVLYLNDLYIKYPDGGQVGDCVFVVRATDTGAGWAYWDGNSREWKLMAGGSVAPPGYDCNEDFNNDFFSASPGYEYLSVDTEELEIPGEIQIATNQSWNIN